MDRSARTHAIEHLHNGRQGAKRTQKAQILCTHVLCKPGYNILAIYSCARAHTYAYAWPIGCRRGDARIVAKVALGIEDKVDDDVGGLGTCVLAAAQLGGLDGTPVGAIDI